MSKKNADSEAKSAALFVKKFEVPADAFGSSDSRGRPRSIAVDEKRGLLYVTSSHPSGSNVIAQFQSDGTFERSFATAEIGSSSCVSACHVDQSTGHVYVGVDGKIHCYDHSGTLVKSITTAKRANNDKQYYGNDAIAVQPDTKNIFVCDRYRESHGAGAIVVYTPDGKVDRVIDSVFNPFHCVFANSGQLVVADYFDGGVRVLGADDSEEKRITELASNGDDEKLLNPFSVCVGGDLLAVGMESDGVQLYTWPGCEPLEGWMSSLHADQFLSDEGITGCAINPSEQQLYTVHLDEECVKIWDVSALL